jgi:L-fuculose-phosphate aldolase
MVKSRIQAQKPAQALTISMEMHCPGSVWRNSSTEGGIVMDTQPIRDRLCQIGYDLFLMGMQTPRSGNLSAMLDDSRSFLITRRGSCTGRLDPCKDLILVELGRPAPQEASSEVEVHRAIYQETQHRAVVHAHPHYAIALSFVSNQISPIHNEAHEILGAIDVTSSSGIEGQGEDPAPIVDVLRKRTAVVVRGHGAFCAAQDLDTALYHIALVESASKIIHLARLSCSR